MDPGDCPLTYLSRSTNHSLSSSISRLLCSPGANGCQWNFVLWPFKGFSASSHLSLADQTPAGIHIWMLSGFLCPLCGLCESSCCNWVLMAFGPPMVGVTPPADCADQPWPQCVRCCVGLTPWSEICHNRVGFLPRSLFACAANGPNWAILWCGLNPTSVLVWGPLGRDSSEDQCQALPMTSLGYQFGTKKLSSLWPPLPGLCLYGRGQAAHQGQFPPAPSPG